MANSVETAVKYSQILDEVFAKEALTRIFDKPQMVQEMAGVGEVKIPKVSTQGLGAYSLTNGFTGGDITFSYETKTLSQRRARKFSLDKIVNAETFDSAFAYAGAQFMRTQVIPEVDAYRISKMFGIAGTTATANLSKTDIAEAITLAEAVMSEAEVPMENRVILITPTKARDLELSEAFTRNSNVNASGETNMSYHIGTFNGMPVIQVPQTRMYTAITMYDGSTSGQETGGYIKNASTGKNINFMIVHVPSVMGVVKLEEMRIFAPTAADMTATGAAGVTQSKLAWEMDFTIYHDLFAGDNKVKGIYAHYATA